MKRKVLALLSAVTVMMASTMTAFAANSPSVPDAPAAPAPGQVVSTVVSEVKTASEYTAVTKVSEGFTVTEVTQTVVQSVVTTVQTQILNNLASFGNEVTTKIAEMATRTTMSVATSSYTSVASAAEDPTKRVTASVLSVVEVSAETATKADNGNYVVTMNVPEIRSNDAIAILHYVNNVWETIIPTSVANGSVTFETASFSPISIVKLEVEDLAAAPKTGETVAVMAIVMLIGLAGAAICGKKYFA